MLPAAVTGPVIEEVTDLLAPGDVVVDGGNGHYHEDIARAAALAERGIAHVDAGVSGGVWEGRAARRESGSRASGHWCSAGTAVNPFRATENGRRRPMARRRPSGPPGLPTASAGALAVQAQW